MLADMPKNHRNHDYYGFYAFLLAFTEHVLKTFEETHMWSVGSVWVKFCKALF